MFDSYFSNTQQLQIFAAFLLIVTSIFLFEFTKKQKTALLVFFSGILTLKLFYALLDPFVHTWDEQVHALVAKNLMNDFLKPTLFPENILSFHHENWTGNYIWVHKQPLFLWQIALSYKLFGVSVFALRLPSVICATLTVFFVYRIGKNFANQKIGFYSALFYGVLNYINETLAAYYPTDHNDIIFLCYVTGSLWAFSEHILNPENKKWIVLIGVFSGLAILTKWLVGLLVYSGWALYTAINNPKKFYLPKLYTKHLKALVITAAIAIPWQIYIITNYPVEAAHEYSYNSKHLTEVIEGHGGNAWFHFDNLQLTIGHASIYFILLGFFLLQYFITDKKVYFVLLFYVSLVFIFFTIAVTKMPAFTLVVYPFIMMGLAAIPLYLIKSIKILNSKAQNVIMALTLVFISFILIKLETTQELHTKWKKNPVVYADRIFYLKWKKTCKYIKSLKLDKSYVVFNCNEFRHISFMFYTDNIGMWGYPDAFTVETLKSKNKKIAVINDGHLPPFCINNKDVLIIHVPS